ncbi:DNA-3-methyladenine glycosylase 2 family protein [Rhizobium sp. LjRoot30]|uniref:DNA-3-methyladenine glycosylase family protein n=1 Tax=Rhizobium sp. LjRoot30 TaxID=3342320 RepID=UPI003ED1683E
MQTIQSLDDIAAGLEALRSIDPRLSAVIDVSGPVPLRLDRPGFAGLAQIIVSQMVSKASAAAIWRRIEAVGGTATASAYLEACKGPDSFGLSRAKADTLGRIAAAVHAGTLDLEAASTLEAKQAFALLTGIKGVGPWTAEVYLMFCGGHPDIFPGGDVALQAAVAHAFGLEKRPSARELAGLTALWAPWRSVAARLFWAYYAARMRRDALPLL